MASLIACPHCGIRPSQEFTIRGDADPRRPASAAPDEEWHDYVYQRRNSMGLMREFWHHAGGCRRWLVVERDNLSHAVHAVTDAGQRRGDKP
ncbi:sarcosine oxidase subunit delta [Allorhizobium undicola]|uniref:sarcosine oxidase subunit delta n=1 Tax=Allorhizobium undicola TaxID=78527 RepID=UPI003D335AC8